MAIDTGPEVRALVFYQVFPRNHGPNGLLRDITVDLPRIAELGVDVLYLMPIHPIGIQGRKGTVGSPYAIGDHRALNPDLGTEEDLDGLLRRAHELDLRVIMDVVFNHTAPDGVLLSQHPEFFHRDAQGKPFTTVPAWSDIIDFSHPNPDLSRYLIDTLAGWVDRGFDGFRCDVASLVPVDFWLQARNELAQRRPGLLWLAETPHTNWVGDRRARGLPTWSDAEMFAAFDVEYTHDVWSIWQAVITGRAPVGRYLEMLRWQQGSLPANHAKLRFVENHDQFRIMRIASTEQIALAWTALMAITPGPLLIQAGQESGTKDWASLFEPAPISWGDYYLTGFVQALSAIVKHPAQLAASFWILADEPTVQVAWALATDEGFEAPSGGTGLFGVFDLTGKGGLFKVSLPDGQYLDLITGQFVGVTAGRIALSSSCAVVEFRVPFRADPWNGSDLLDVFLTAEEMGDTAPNAGT